MIFKKCELTEVIPHGTTRVNCRPDSQHFDKYHGHANEYFQMNKSMNKVLTHL